MFTYPDTQAVVPHEPIPIHLQKSYKYSRKSTSLPLSYGNVHILFGQNVMYVTHISVYNTLSARLFLQYMLIVCNN